MIKRRIKLSEVCGFSLAELLMAAVILTFAFLAALMTYVRCMDLNEMSQSTSLALRASKSRMEVIKNTTFDQLVATYQGVTFTTAPLNGLGVSVIDSINVKLFGITVSYCWQQKSGRIVGECQIVGGVLTWVDVNANGVLDSPVQLETRIYDT